jgi:hypothetical protein
MTKGALVSQADGPAYEIPAPSVCASCHGGSKDFVLGFDLVGLGAGAKGLTLATLPPGWLTHAPPASAITLPEDKTKKAAPALGFLHVNCGVSCHNRGSGRGGSSGLYLKLLTAQLFPVPDAGPATVTGLDTYTTTVNVTGQLDLGQYLRIAPGKSAESLLPLMALARAPDAGAFLPMPPLVSHRPDTDPLVGLPVVQAWIDAL